MGELGATWQQLDEKDWGSEICTGFVNTDVFRVKDGAS